MSHDTDKEQLRRRALRLRRLSGTNIDLAQALSGVGRYLKPLCRRNRPVARYWSMATEPDPGRVLQPLCGTHREHCAPWLAGRIGGVMAFRGYRRKSRQRWRRNRFGFVEMGAGAGRRVHPASMGMVLLPLLAFDDRGGRLGRGKGHYDRALAKGWQRPMLVGLAWPAQQVAQVPVEAHDLPLDAALTTAGLQLFSTRAKRRCHGLSSKSAGKRDWRFLPGKCSPFAPSPFRGRQGFCRPAQNPPTPVRRRRRGCDSGTG